MNEIKDNKMLWVLIAFVLINTFVFFVGKVFVSKVSDSVIQKLKKDYSPSPYGPGFDPDKMGSGAFKTSEYFNIKDQETTDKIIEKIAVSKKDETKSMIQEIVKEGDIWRTSWEKEGGFIPSQ